MNNVEINDRCARNTAQSEPVSTQVSIEHSFPLENNQHNNRDRYEVMKDYAHDILKQLAFLDGWFSVSQNNSEIRYNRKVNDGVDMEDAVEPSIRPVYWISKWVDYSDKYT